MEIIGELLITILVYHMTFWNTCVWLVKCGIPSTSHVVVAIFNFHENWGHCDV